MHTQDYNLEISLGSHLHIRGVNILCRTWSTDYQPWAEASHGDDFFGLLGIFELRHFTQESGFLSSFGKIELSVFPGPASHTLVTSWRWEDIISPLTSEAVSMLIRWLGEVGPWGARLISSKTRKCQELGKLPSSLSSSSCQNRWLELLQLNITTPRYIVSSVLIYVLSSSSFGGLWFPDPHTNTM